MSGPENTYISSVHKHLPPTLYRMKNHNQYNGGIADVWYSGKQDLWIEYKFISVAVRDSTAVDLISGKKPEISYLQQEWLTQRHLEGRRVGVIVGCRTGGVWYPGLSWNRKSTALEFRSSLHSRPNLAEIIIGVVS